MSSSAKPDRECLICGREFETWEALADHIYRAPGHADESLARIEDDRKAFKKGYARLRCYCGDVFFITASIRDRYEARHTFKLDREEVRALRSLAKHLEAVGGMAAHLAELMLGVRT